MGAREVGKWSVIGAFASSVVWLATCNLNGQPLPPTPAEGNDTSGTADSGTFAGASSYGRGKTAKEKKKEK